MVRVEVKGDLHATVTAELKKIRPYNYFADAIDEGETLVFTAICRDGNTSWSLSGSAPESVKRQVLRGMQ
jgi:hypothetical protein